MLGTWTWGGKMEGADKSTVLSGQVLHRKGLSIVRSKCFILNIMILLAQRIRLCLSSFTSCCLRSNPVWPDLAKFHHFDQYLKIFAIFLRFLWFWPKFSAHFDTICMHLGKFLLLKMAKYWEHNLVTLVESQAHYIPFFRDL